MFQFFKDSFVTTLFCFRQFNFEEQFILLANTLFFNCHAEHSRCLFYDEAFSRGVTSTLHSSHNHLLILESFGTSSTRFFKLKSQLQLSSTIDSKSLSSMFASFSRNSFSSKFACHKYLTSHRTLSNPH